jgi:predicted transcriptional regulator
MQQEMKARGIRIDDKTWRKLEKLAEPENVSILIRKILREFLENQTRT